MRNMPGLQDLSLGKHTKQVSDDQQSRSAKRVSCYAACAEHNDDWSREEVWRTIAALSR